MKIKQAKMISTLIWISAILILAGCTSVSQVMPNNGPSMEQQYDGMGKAKIKPDANWANSQSKKNVSMNTGLSQNIFAPDNTQDNLGYGGEASLSKVRNQLVQPAARSTSLSQSVPVTQTWQNFHKVPNPSLQLYIYPHLSGNDELPVPGYTTAFNVYEKDHYALPNDM